MVFFIVGCAKRRSTRTTTVLSCLSLTTTPWSVRFGILNPLFLRLRLGARLRLRSGLRLGGFGLFCRPRRSIGLWSRLGRSDALLCRDRFHPRDIAPDDAHARGILELSRGTLKAQIELLFLELEDFVIKLIERHCSCVGGFHGVTRQYVQ